VATIIDLAIVFIAWFLSLFLFVAVLSILGALDPTQVGAAGLDPLALSSKEIALGFFGAGILFAIGGFYHVYAWSRLGATPGQQLLKMRVLDAQTGHLLGPARAAARWFVAELPGLNLVFGPYILLWYATVAVSVGRDPQRRGVHDRAAGSVVVRYFGTA